jgi:hypothetical protein
LADILRELADAPPGGHRFALVRAARAYGPEALEEQAELVAALPDDLRVRLTPTSPGADRNLGTTQGSEIA